MAASWAPAQDRRMRLAAIACVWGLTGCMAIGIGAGGAVGYGGGVAFEDPDNRAGDSRPRIVGMLIGATIGGVIGYFLQRGFEDIASLARINKKDPDDHDSAVAKPMPA